MTQQMQIVGETVPERNVGVEGVRVWDIGP